MLSWFVNEAIPSLGASMMSSWHRNTFRITGWMYWSLTKGSVMRSFDVWSTVLWTSKNCCTNSCASQITDAVCLTAVPSRKTRTASALFITGTLWVKLPQDSPYKWPVMQQTCLCHDIMVTHDDVIKWKHFPRYWPFVRGIHRSPVNSPHKGQWRGALMFSLICVWING